MALEDLGPAIGSDGAEEQEKGSNVLLIGIILGVVLGALAGGFSPAFGRAVAFVGEVFLHALMLMVIPLVMASMIMGIAALGDVRKLGGIGLRTIIYYTMTTALAVAIGLAAVNLVKPGSGVSTGETLKTAWRTEDGRLVLEGAELKRADYGDSYRVVVTAPGPDGEPVAHFGRIAKSKERSKTELPIASWSIQRTAEVEEGPPSERQTGAKRVRVKAPTAGTGLTIEPVPKENVEEKTIVEVLEEVILGMVPKNLIKAAAETQVLPVIIFSLVFGGILTTLGKRGQHVILFFDGVNEAIMKMVQLLMYTAPVGIFALVAGRLGDADGFEGFLPDLIRLGKYAGTVIGGLGFHGIVVLPALLLLVGKRNPLSYARGMMTALTTAFSTSSSAASLPLTLRGVEKNGVSERSASFVCPLGATINMDGTAMYEAVAAMFIAQAYGIELSGAHQLIIFLTATLAAIGAAGIPEAGIVTMVIVLNAVKLPVEGIGLILVIDWFLDRCRTTVNVWGDSIGAAVIDRLEESALLGSGKPAGDGGG